MGCCCSKDQEIHKIPIQSEGMILPIIPAVEVHTSSIFESKFQIDQKNQNSPLLEEVDPELRSLNNIENDESSTSSLDHEGIQSILDQVNISDE